MKRMRMGLIGLVALAATALAPQAALADCQIGNCWGAVAYGPGGAWAYAVNHPTRQAASQIAQGQCRGRCTRVLTFKNSCGAYATGANGYGWGNAPTRAQAEGRALQECAARTQACAGRGPSLRTCLPVPPEA
jgi:hypothetical protein